MLSSRDIIGHDEVMHFAQSEEQQAITVGLSSPILLIFHFQAQQTVQTLALTSPRIISFSDLVAAEINFVEIFIKLIFGFVISN